MKSYPYKYLMMLLLLYSNLTAFATRAAKIELRKNLSKEYAVNNYSQLEISNRYGLVQLKTWDKNQVKIDVAIIVKSTDKDYAQKKMEEIKVDLRKEGNSIIGITEIHSTNKWNIGIFNNPKLEFDINYTIMLPAYLQSIIENKYGNIELPELNNLTSISLSYGNLIACNINAPLRLNMAYSNGTVGNTKELTGSLSYSNLVSQNTATFNIDSKYSNINMGDCESSVLSSKYDHYVMGDVDKLVFDGKYTDLNCDQSMDVTITSQYGEISIGGVSQKLTSTLSYGGLVINTLSPSAKSVTVTTRYAPIVIKNCTSASLDISGSYYSADLGDDFVHSGQKVKNKHVGYKGNKSSATSIVITTSYGDVSIH
jgi:hypothetical protein